MLKKIAIAIILFLVTFFVYQNWDILFSQLQHIYFSFVYMSFSSSNNESIIESRIIESLYLNTSMRLNIYLPKNYYSQRKRNYPVLFLLHGYPGTENDWLTNTNLQKRLDEKIRTGKIPPLIVVFPDMNGPRIRDSQYLNATKIDQKMESYFIHELMPYVETNYKTIKSQSNRAIGGLSSGGYGALYLGLKYNNLFSYIFSHSGYMTNNEPVMNQLIENIVKNRDRYSPLDFVDKIKVQKPLFIYFDIGKNDDKSFVAENYAFNEKLNTLNINHVMKITEGGHGWGVWGKNIENSLIYLNLINSH